MVYVQKYSQWAQLIANTIVIIQCNITHHHPPEYPPILPKVTKRSTIDQNQNLSSGLKVCG